MSNPTPSFVTHPVMPVKAPAPAPVAKPAAKPMPKLNPVQALNPAADPPKFPPITVPTVNGVPQTELPHPPPGYSYR